jgi:hypothetical protein
MTLPMSYRNFRNIMPKAELWAAHTPAFAGAFLMTAAAAFCLKHGPPDLSFTPEVLIVTGLGILWALLEAALYALGCAWGGVSRPRRTIWAFACGVLTAVGFFSYAATESAFPPPTDMNEAQQQYTRGSIGVLYTILVPVAAGLISAWFSKRAR